MGLKVGDRVIYEGEGCEGTITKIRPRYDTRTAGERSQFLAWKSGCLVRFDGDTSDAWVYLSSLKKVSSSVRSFPSGATRDTDQGKIDFEGFLSPLALEAFGEYMHKHQLQADGSLRSSDNWQKGIPVEAYMKSAWRHFFAVWRGYRQGEIDMEDLCALMFNVQGLLHETVKKGGTV